MNYWRDERERGARREEMRPSLITQISEAPAASSMSGQSTAPRPILRPLEALSPFGEWACLWLNGSPDSERRVWRDIWNKAPLRLCTDGGANLIRERVESRILAQPTLISGDMDSISSESSEYFTGLGCQMIPTPDQASLSKTTDDLDAQDKTDMTKALEIVAEMMGKNGDCPSGVVVLGGLSGRFDHTMAALNSLLVATRLLLPPVVLLDGLNIAFVIPEEEIHVDRSLLSGICGIVPFCQKTTIVSTKGLRWNLEETEMSFGGLISTSNEITHDVIVVKSSAPLIVTLELLPLATD